MSGRGGVHIFRTKVLLSNYKVKLKSKQGSQLIGFERLFIQFFGFFLVSAILTYTIKIE